MATRVQRTDPLSHSRLDCQVPLNCKQGSRQRYRECRRHYGNVLANDAEIQDVIECRRVYPFIRRQYARRHPQDSRFLRTSFTTHERIEVTTMAKKQRSTKKA